MTKIPNQGTLNATPFSPACMQYGTGTPSVFSEYLLGDASRMWATQQCDIGDELPPVTIWIPGGALVSGGSAVPYTNGARFAEAQKMVIVSLDYRVNIFGFPGAGGLDGRSLNPSLLDQRKAVESRGGSSPNFWTYAWPGDPLVRGFIVMHGAVGNHQVAMNRTGNLAYVAEQVGCSGLDKDEELWYVSNGRSNV
ncbi:Alpha/Beta hydrolase protein [Dactylonectria estremocensis]|uniref:Alpha/Beta hydrolase protein n=1 Tax=Dactylonectria estremocensis TaxID=1079267 RepID=A0A9P9IMT8_9HYPO|nr:Alpha/Beta hydrolase protein [Dactylonectria estremocensis]